LYGPFTVVSSAAGLKRERLFGGKRKSAAIAAFQPESIEINIKL
jgi:hypothetical protein